MTKKAAIYMLLSVLCFTCMNLFVKRVAYFSTYELLFFRAIGSLILALFFLRVKKIPLKTKNQKLLIARGVIGLISVAFYFASMNYLPVGIAVSLRYTSPIFAVLLAVFFLKTKVKKIQWFYFFVAFIGVLLIKGFDQSINLKGLLLVLISAFFSGLVYVVISKIGKSAHPILIIVYFMSIITLFGGILSVFYWKTPVGIEWFYLLSLGVFGYFGQLFMTKSYQIGEASKVVPLKYVEVIITMFVGAMWLGDQYSFLAIIGVMLIIIVLILNVIYKGITSR